MIDVILVHVTKGADSLMETAKHFRKFCYERSIRNPIYHPDAYHLDSLESVPLIIHAKLEGIHSDKKSSASSSWILQIDFGRGAGFTLGRTLYLAKNVVIRTASGSINKSWASGFTSKIKNLPKILGLRIVNRD